MPFVDESRMSDFPLMETDALLADCEETFRHPPQMTSIRAGGANGIVSDHASIHSSTDDEMLDISETNPRADLDNEVADKSHGK